MGRRKKVESGIEAPVKETEALTETAEKDAPTEPLLPLTQLAELEYEDLVLPASAFPANALILSPEPTPEFVKNIKRRGIIMPVLCYRRPDDTIYIMAGKRRVKAARQIHPEHPVPARMYKGVPLWDSLTIEAAENACRRANDLSDLHVLLQLRNAGQSLSYSMLPKGTIRKRLKILALEPELIQAVTDGRLAMATAEAMTRLTPEERQPFIAKLAEPKGKVSSKDVAQVQWAKARAAATAQPGLPAQDLEAAYDAGNLFVVLTPDLVYAERHPRQPIEGLNEARRFAGRKNRVFKLVEM